MEEIIQAFHGTSVKPPSVVEFEAQIGDRISTTIIDYHNVIQWLLYSGFTIEDVRGQDIFRVITDHHGLSYRFELTNLSAIQHYCKTSVLLNPVVYTKKGILKHPIKEYNSKLSLSIETQIPDVDREKVIESLLNSTKTYRYMNRVRLSSKKYPFVFDCSIVKMSTDLGKVFDMDPAYEIECEIHDKKTTKVSIQQAITFVTRGYQRSYYPISISETRSVIDAYHGVTSTRDFIGPGSVTLQQNNVDNIFNDYVVTEKADGERKMMFVTNNKIYLLTSAMKVEYTGFSVKGYNGTLIDGEHVIKDKHKNKMNAFLAFDLYFKTTEKTSTDFRPFPFLAFKGSDGKTVDTRYLHMNSIVKHINDNRKGEPSADLIFTSKKFVPCRPESCKEIIESKDYPYHVDGIIFTPMKYGVGMTETQPHVINRRFTWDLSFKWKPPEENTIDFYVMVDEKPHYKTTSSGAEECKMVRLFSGFNKNDVNPYGRQYVNHQYCIFNRFDVIAPPEKTQNIPFKPGAIPHYSMVPSMDGMIRTQYGEPIESKMILECKYVPEMDGPEESKWVPLRVRWDKMVRRNPNALTTALNNWYTIVHPIGIDALYSTPRTVYYEHMKKDIMKGLRQFHNHVKYSLLNLIKEGDIVLDFAVGKGGDLLKWKKASFVLGIDIFENNLIDKTDGAGQRYLSMIKQGDTKTRCLFLHGTSTKNIKHGEAMFSDYENAIAQSVFGVHPKNPSLGKGVLDHYGKGKLGFNLTSIQFAIHYMFESVETLTNFIKNVAECTAMNGYFVGTCYDGAMVFDKLKGKKELEIKQDGQLLCSIEKKYPQVDYMKNKSCLGYKIGVYQSTIGTQKIDEYLVFFDYFIPLMEEYGFMYKENLSASFKSIYESDPSARSTRMNEGEQEVSFLNRTFVFEKVKEMKIIPTKLHFITI